MSRWGLRFVATSFFPSIPLDSIWEIEFQMNLNFQSFAIYNHLEYFELIWHYERLVEYRKQENNSEGNNGGRMSLNNLGSNMFQNMQGDMNAG